MALDYTLLFGDLGKIIARLDSYDVLGETQLPADLLTLETQFGVRWLPYEGIATQYGSMQSQVSDWRRTLAGYADRRLLDRDLVLTQLGLGQGSSLDDVLQALVRQMLADGKRVKACVCAATTPAADSANRGDGRAWVTTMLDGYNAPLSGGRADVRYDGLPSELCVPAETMTLECVGDSVTDGLTEGGESFSWTGAPDNGPLDVRGEGSGRGPGLSVATEGNNLLSGGGFGTFSSGAPSGWTVEAGSGQTSQETTTTFRGGSALKIAGGVALVRLSQALASGLVQGRRRYFLGLALRASAVAAGATVRAYLCSSSGTPLGGAIELDGASLPTAWSAQGTFVGFPSPLPSPWKVVLEVASLPAGVSLYLDDAALTPAVYHGGVGVALTAGATPFQRGDRIAFAASNDGAGLFQSFWRRWYRAQLPSVAAGSRPYAGLALLWRMMAATVTETVPDSQVV